MEKPKTKFKEEIKLAQQPKQTQFFRQQQQQRSDQRLDTSQILKQQPKQKQQERQKQETRQRSRQALSPFFKLSSKQKLRQREIIRQRSEPRQRPRPEERFRRGGGFELPESKQIKSKGKKRTKPTGIFTPEIRRKGKWMPLGRFETIKKAFQKGRGETLQTLGASFRIRKGKDIVPIRPKTIYFRPSKRDRGVLVQKKKAIGSLYRGRLTTPSEIKEIIRAKNIKFFT